MHIEPCRDEEHEKEKKDAKEIQLEKAHLHDMIGDVVHVHYKGTRWKDLFANLNYKVN